MNSEDTAQNEGPTAYPSAAPLEFRSVGKRYPGADRPAIEDLSFAVPAGEICVLVGPSGCGKTTAMRLVNRMIDMTSGEILLDGKSITTRKGSDLRREIGYVIQQIGLFPHLTIAQNVATVPKLLGWDKHRTERRVAELMELIGLDPDLGARYPGQLSGGQRQRVGVARALAADPPLMLMDEPFGAIDPINRARLQNEFLRLQSQIRKTIVFVTHDIDEAIKMGDRIAILREGGHLAQFATPDELLAAPADDFVAKFVGADRGLKRLTLSRLADVELADANVAHIGTPAEEARRIAQQHGANELVVLDSAEQPIGRLPIERLNGLPVAAEDAEPLAAIAGRDTSLHDALSLVVADRNRPLVVVEADGRLAGLVSLELISNSLRPPE
ncbi:ABC transporter ATP-binding protein [Conexibacter sp. CPCC 206217]|uniref:ABC transporter ATP-binding protein n=1 Tax=Conexibacter sp. CPCC 206217 TaxID=3064574 RepID=UPI0027239D54|nr:ATP-binding cassette domain-containing protein [Conexibacter sp. CPCC 206217]MDO8210554.1 ATP-binding cassette domain-containing protein [Conexibacter sp. CPCC 206217]